MRRRNRGLYERQQSTSSTRPVSSVSLAPLPAPPRPTSSKHGRTFRATLGVIKSLDPNLCHETAGNNVAMQLFEPLLNHNIRSGPPVPGVATHFTVSKDGKVYTFHLRENARWSNGRAVTAQDFVYSWRRGLDPKTRSHTVQQLWFIQNAEDYSSGKIKDFAKVGVRAVSDRVLQVTLRNPAPFFPYLVSYMPYAPVPREAVEAHGALWTQPAKIVTNGAYVLSEWKLRQKVVLTQNPHYWDRGRVWIERVEYTISEREAHCIDLYLRGMVEHANTLPRERIGEFLREGRRDFHVDPWICTYYYVFRLDTPPFDNKMIRHAMNIALNKKKLVSYVLGTGQKPASGLVPPVFRDNLGYVSPIGDTYDPECAKWLVARSGVERVGSPSVIYNNYEGHVLIATFLQRNMKEALNINLRLENLEWKTLLNRVSRGEFQLARDAWCADYPDPYSFLEVFHSKSPNNPGKYNNPSYDAVLARILAEPDTARRNKLIAEAEAMLNDDLPIIPVYYYTRNYMLKPYVGGFEPHFQDYHLVKYIYYKE